MIFEYKGREYPEFLKQGNAVQYITPFLDKLCHGKGLDIGCGPNPYRLATPIDKKGDFHAYQLPEGQFDFIVSSHSLEHLENPVEAIKLWREHLKPRGLLFLYLPHPDMEYWRPQNNLKHLHMWHPFDMVQMIKDLGFVGVQNSEKDLFYSYCVYGYKDHVPAVGGRKNG